MLKFKSWRYKCEFCGKNGRSGGHMKRHELGCTANPNRICTIHRHLTGDNDVGIMPVAPLVMLLRKHYTDPDHGLAALREATYNCPCCILAAIRQAGLCKGFFDEDGYTPPLIGTEQFDFKKELAELWANVNDAKEQERSYY